MGKRNRWRDHPDPEHRRWGATYPVFPGVAECVRLIREGKARGSWADLIALELAENADACFDDLVFAFQENERDAAVRRYVLTALEEAKLPKSVPFLVALLNAEDELHRLYAERALRAIDTKEARTSLFEAFDEER